MYQTAGDCRWWWLSSARPRGRLLSAPANLSLRPQYYSHDLTSLLPLCPFPAFYNYHQSIGVCLLPHILDHVLFGTFPVKVCCRPSCGFSSYFPRALPSDLSPLVVHTSGIPEAYHITTNVLHNVLKTEHRSRNREPERKT